MDSSPMDYHMRHPAGLSSPPVADSFERAARSRCPALRSPFERSTNPSQRGSPPRGNSHYYDLGQGMDANYGQWGPHANFHRDWQHPVPQPQSSHVHDPFPLPSTVGPSHNFDHAQPPYPFTNNAHERYASQVNTPMQYRPSLPTLPRPGNMPPVQQGPRSYSSTGPPPGSTHHLHNQAIGAGLPSMSSMRTLTSTSVSQANPVSVPNSRPSQMPESSSLAPFHSRQSSASSVPDSRPETGLQASSAYDSQNPQRFSRSPMPSEPPISQGMNGQAVNQSNQPENRRYTPPGARQTLPRVSSSNSEWSSDDDPDPLDTDSSALFIEAVPSGDGVEDRVRAQQLLRGAVSGRRIASKKALASLQSIDINELPESERTCIICYNDFGVQSPEGINEAPLRLPKCKHVFGDHCIKKWFEESDSCPYCRDKVPSEPQFRHGGTSGVVRFIRQQHMHFQQLHAMRQSPSRTRDANDFESATRAVSFSQLASLSPHPFAEPEHISGSGDFTRRMETPRRYERGQHGFNSSPSAMQPSTDRRSPPNDSNDTRRRTRPRHSTLRGPPPFGRPMSFGSSHASNPSQTPDHPEAQASLSGTESQTPLTDARSQQYPWNNRLHPSHNPRYSTAMSSSNVGPAFDANMPAFPFYPAAAPPSENFSNPLIASGSNTSNTDFHSTYNHVRSNYMPNPEPNMRGPDFYAGNPNAGDANRTTSQPTL